MKRFSTLIILMGVLLMLYPLFSYFYAQYEQGRLRASPADVGESMPGDLVLSEPFPVEQGEFAGALMEIPAIGMSAVVLRGTSQDNLAKGPGWYEESALPGQGNTAVAGHRTMFGAWFRHLDRLAPGDCIKLDCGGCTYSYMVERVFEVAKDDWSVIDPCGYPALTLTTCHPVGSASQRLVVRAALVQEP